jgi:ABC-type multidrug transport system fused ATPase/permease subunit
LASAHDFIMRFPFAYDTMLGPVGVQLSRGQRQSLCIARGLLKDPRLLILDEATSALDAESERAVLKNIRWLASGRLTLVLSRRPLAVQPNDLIVVLEDGRIVDQGTHGQLLKKPGLYVYLGAGQAQAG